MVRLKKLASTCSFGAILEEAHRDRLVSGLHSKISRTQRHLLAVREQTFTAARDQCNSYKLPNVQDMFAMLSQDGSTPDTFSVTDLASVFNQFLLDDESSQLLTIDTRVKRFV